jgi:hypothetical protein
MVSDFFIEKDFKAIHFSFGTVNSTKFSEKLENKIHKTHIRINTSKFLTVMKLIKL